MSLYYYRTWSWPSSTFYIPKNRKEKDKEKFHILAKNCNKTLMIVNLIFYCNTSMGTVKKSKNPGYNKQSFQLLLF